MTTARRIARRWPWLFAGALVFLFVGVVWGANVVTDGTMETNPLVNWTHTDITAGNTTTKATDQKGGGTYSLKTISPNSKKGAFEWTDHQSVGSIEYGSTVLLSLWYGTLAGAAVPATATALSAEISTDGAVWTTIWTANPTPAMTFASGTATSVDVSSFFTTTSTYQLKLRAKGATGNSNTANVSVWWDNVVLDVTAPPPLALTISDGTNPSNVTGVCPGDTTPSYVDAFRLQGNRNVSVTAATVALATSTWQSIGLIEITNDGGTAVYGTLSNPTADSVVVPFTVTQSSTQTQYKIRITPKAATSMPAVPGGTYAVTARVTGVTSDAVSTTGSDGSSATVTIDNLSPSNATAGASSAGDGYVDIAWTNPGDTDFSQAIVIRGTAPITDAPTEGATYSMPGNVGSTPIVAIGTMQSLHDTTVANGSTYYYKIFAKDSCGNYSSGVQVGPLSPVGTPHLTTVGDGTDPTPSPVTLCPGDGATMLDAFTLTAAVGTDTVSAVEVTLGTNSGIGLLEITNDDGTSAFGSVANPGSTVVNVPVSPNITVTTSVTPYKVRITPRSHATMPANAASPYAVTGIVTALTSTDPKSYSDTDSAVVNIDNSAPSAPTWGSAAPGDNQVALQWTNPGDFQSVMIARSTATITAVPTEGSTYNVDDLLAAGVVVRYTGSSTTFTDTPLTNGTTYYYKIFARDACGNWSAGAETSATPTSVLPAITVSAGTASVDSCTQVTARVAFTGDQPSNSSTKFERSTTVNGPWTLVCDAVTTSSPRSCVMGTLTAATTYYVKVTFTDADGVTGQNPQIVGPVTTPAVCAPATTTAGTATVSLNSCKQATVVAPFSGDGDNDGTVRVEYNTSNAWPGSVACETATGGTPRSCIVSGLTASTQYWFHVTYSDADGIAGGTAVQTLGPVTTGACGADTTAPMVLFLAPGRDAVIGGNERFKVQVFDAGGLAGSNPVQWAIDTAAVSATGVSVNSNYSCGAGCAVYEFTMATDALANGAHSVKLQVTDAAGNVATAVQPVVVNNRYNLPFGTGTLLRRTHSSQLCMDCHAIQSHSSQSTESPKYGSWAVDCLSCHTPHGTSNIALIRRDVRTPNSGIQTVDFRTLDKTGGTNPQYSQLGAYDGTGAPFNDGVCEVCHTKTTHYRNSASGGDHTHNQATRCTSCHSHTKGFKGAGCNGCHSAPPTVGKHRTKHDEVWDSTEGKMPSAYDDAASHATATQYGFGCSKCHAGTHQNDSTVNPTHDGTATNPWQVEILFDGANISGTYAATYKENVDKPATDNFSWSNGTCSNTYCHSNASPAGGTNAPVPVTWSGASTTCVSCHKTGGFGDGTNDATYLSKSHATHIKSASAETNTYAFKCNACHDGVIVSSPNDPWLLASTDLKDKQLHVNESKQDVAFSSLGSINQSAGIYDGSGTKSCGGTYCHSPGNKTASFDPPNVALAWGQPATCRSCHSGNATTAPTMASGKHNEHVNIAATFGNNIGCVSCHSATVSDDSTIGATGHANHVNGTRDVAGTYSGTWGGSGTPTCTNSRCHSSGVRAGTIEYYTMNWSTGPAITDCEGCHGRHSDNAFASVAGEPNYTNVPASSKYNSHKAHVAVATDCHACHASTVGTSNKIDGTNPAKHMDFDGVPDITFAAPYAAGTYDPPTRTCTVGCHGAGAPTWGGTVTCLNCHGTTGTETDDMGATFWSNQTAATINTTEWTYSGHGKTSGTYDITTNPAAALPTSPKAGTSECLYCHDDTVAHKLSTNPFRLRKSGNAVCLDCHQTGSAGVAPTGQTLKNGTIKADATHAGSKHTASTLGGTFCWDCHDPHGDRPSNTNSSSYNIAMIGKKVRAVSDGVYGYVGASGVERTVEYYNITAAINSPSPVGRIVESTTALGTNHLGLCQACHNPTTATPWTKYWGSTGYDDPDGPGGAAAYKSGVTTGTHHNTTTYCIDCHKHANKFAGGGGDCLNCHGAQTQGSTPVRRAVTADFADGTTPAFRSHHVGNGTANTLKGTLTNFDCVVCHAEGAVVTSPTRSTVDTLQHMNGVIDLRNIDSTTAYFSYDKDAVTASAGATLSQWSSANAVWRTQTSTALDPFCLSCHDSDGALQAGTFGEVAGLAATNPFNDTQIANNYDQLVRGKPIDVKTKVMSGVTMYSRHAIRGTGMAPSVYGVYTGALTGCSGTTNCKPIYDYGLFVANGTDENGKPNWNDTSLMGCADCHTTDGANGSAGNAHGSASEYLLKDGSGGATEGTLAGLSYVCYRCHKSASYKADGVHTGNAQDFQDYTANVGTGRIPVGNTGGSRFGMACMNCHGGAPSHSSATVGTDGYGWIHGTNETYYVGYTTTTRNAYRFMNGGSMRFWDPNGWNTATGTCYTLGGTGRPADQWGGCTKHSSGTNAFTRPVQRPLSY